MKIDARRIRRVGCASKEPAGADSDFDGRGELRWFTLQPRQNPGLRQRTVTETAALSIMVACPRGFHVRDDRDAALAAASRNQVFVAMRGPATVLPKVQSA